MVLAEYYLQWQLELVCLGKLCSNRGRKFVSSKVNEYVIADAMAQLKVQTSCLDAPKQVQSCFQTTKSLSQNQNQNHRITESVSCNMCKILFICPADGLQHFLLDQVSGHIKVRALAEPRHAACRFKFRCKQFALQA